MNPFTPDEVVATPVVTTLVLTPGQEEAIYEKVAARKQAEEEKRKANARKDRTFTASLTDGEVKVLRFMLSHDITVPDLLVGKGIVKVDDKAVLRSAMSRFYNAVC